MKAAATSQSLAHDLERIADLLSAQAAPPPLVASFRRGAAGMARASPGMAVDDLVAGMDDLVAACATQLIRWGRCPLLIRLAGGLSLEEQLVAITSIGPTLARRIVAALDLETLEEVIAAAEDGRLARINGVGPLRGQGIARQGRSLLDPLPRARRVSASEPSVDLVLALDDEYRRMVRGGGLPALVPVRHNPTRAPSMPVFHAEIGGWNAMVHFSNRASSGDGQGQAEARSDRVIVCLRRGGVEIQRVVMSVVSGDTTRVRRPAAGRATMAGAGATLAV
jgi:hypothetical protein